MNASFRRAQRAWEASWINGPADSPYEDIADPTDLTGEELLAEAIDMADRDLPRAHIDLMLEALHREILALEEPPFGEPSDEDMVLVDQLFELSLRYRDML